MSIMSIESDFYTLPKFLLCTFKVNKSHIWKGSLLLPLPVGI